MVAIHFFLDCFGGVYLREAFGGRRIVELASITDLPPDRPGDHADRAEPLGRRAPRLNETYPAQTTKGSAYKRCVDNGPMIAAAAISSPAAIRIPVKISPMPKRIASVPTSHCINGDMAPFGVGSPKCGTISMARAANPYTPITTPYVFSLCVSRVIGQIV